LLILKLLPFRGFLAHSDLAALNQLPWAGYSWWNRIPQVDFSSTSWQFPAESHTSGGFLIPELVIPGGKTILPLVLLLKGGNSRQNHYLSCGGRVLAVRRRKITEAYFFLKSKLKTLLK
jgi:hypothetical protein